jgi:hypothetical protein
MFDGAYSESMASHDYHCEKDWKNIKSQRKNSTKFSGKTRERFESRRINSELFKLNIF